MAEPLNRTEAQRLAADPSLHVWVAASAGTGKTHVLTDRILRLLLAGSPPERILALTFTRAAAAEMQNRVVRALGRWATAEDDRLAAELRALGLEPTEQRRQRARSLFAHALDVPGGLHVQTLHAFAQGLLAAFPLEAGLPPGFVALDERDARELQRRALAECIDAARASGDGRFLDDLAALAVLKGEGGLHQMLGRMLGHAGALLQFHDADGLAAAVFHWLDLDDGEQPGDGLRQALAADRLDAAPWLDLAALLERWGTKTGTEAAAAVRQWLALDDDGRVAGFELLRGAVLTKAGTVNAHLARARLPGLAELAEAQGALLSGWADRENRARTAALAVPALRAGHRFAAACERLKRAMVAIDFDDMIERTAQLLGPPGMVNYVGWKIDSRFDHVLVDEAQDTSNRQWRIIGKLVEEFFAGVDERGRRLFVVGDHKQSIYGFQGTDPDVFEAWRGRLRPAALASGHPLHDVDLALSFRSGPAVLAVVNAFLERVGGAALGMAGAPPPHQPNRKDAAGEVVLWPTVELADDDDETGGTGADAAAREMAKRLAAQIAAWLRPGDPERLWLAARGRFARPGDILVLVRKRGQLMAAAVHALHAARVPVAGVDKLLLTEPLAALDLLALVRFAVQPGDDLNLAALLASPLLGFDHEEIREIRLLGGADGLWAALGRAADGTRAHQARRFLRQVLNLADRDGPYGFLDRILSGPLEGRRRLVARLGAEANDPIDELLQQALLFEQQPPPALAGFLSWIETTGVELKREADSAPDEVRLMTIHGSKGLEAPVVVLADAATRRKARADGYVLADLPGAGPLPLFHLPKGAGGWPERIAALHEAAEAVAAQEELRLLYVGLTRAADHLFIGGARATPREGGGESWHQLLAEVMAAMAGVEQRASAIWGDGVLRVRAGLWTRPEEEPPLRPDAARHEQFAAIHVTPAPPPGRPARPLTPSATAEQPPEGPAAEALRAAGLRGEQIHRLFERLPALAPAERRPAGLAWLARQGAGAEAGAMLAEVLAVIEDPANAALFGPDSLAEAPIAGLVGDAAVVGVVDRLLVEDDRVLVVDFKTGRFVPDNGAAVPLPHRRQMAAYAEVLRRAFPGRRIEAALLYTRGPKLLPLGRDDMAGLLPLA